MAIKLEDVKEAFQLLKRDVYYDTSNLFIRESIAKFEQKSIEDNCEFTRQSEKTFEEIVSFINSKNLNDVWFVNQLKSIDTFLLPKKVFQEAPLKDFTFITNTREAKEYEITDVFYYFTSEISLFILSILWCIKSGRYLDQQLTKDCYGNRLNLDKESRFFNKNEKQLFKLYFHQYSKWRDGAIDHGLDLLKKEKNALVIALDMKQCFYRLEVDWHSIKEELKRQIKSIIELEEAAFLTDVMEQIHEKYYKHIKPLLRQTLFKDEEGIPIGIPIGLTSSNVLANWELKKLDDVIREKLRPCFYGRYVDDLLIVLNDPKEDLFLNDAENILNEYFVKNNIFEKITEEKISSKQKSQDPCGQKMIYYKINMYDYLKIQSEKLIVHYYRHDHSWAGLKEFKEEIRNRGSEFRFLPTEDQYKDLYDEAYDLHYEGSINKFRSLIGITENQNKLMQFLFKQQLKSWLCAKPLDPETVKEIFRFFKGRNILSYLRTWEKIFTLFSITNKEHEFNRFDCLLSKTIEKLSFGEEKTNEQKDNFSYILEKLIHDTKHFAFIAKALAKGYKSISNLSNIAVNQDKNNNLSAWLRTSLMLRHQNIVWPLLDYTNYSGSLSNFNIIDLKNLNNLMETKIEFPSRYIHADEILVFNILKRLLSNNHADKKHPFYYFPEFVFDDEDLPLKSISEYLKKNVEFEKNEIKEYPSRKYTDFSSQVILETHIKEDKRCNPDMMCIGIANVKVEDARIKKCMKAKTPLSDKYEKQNTLFNLLNLAQEYPKCDLVVFPEVFIPFGWLPFMINQARRKQIGLVFGLEHINVGHYSYNLVATILPYRDENGHCHLHLSIRLKNYYSPSEKEELKLLDLERPSFPALYEIFHWHGSVFTVFNCFELTDILHRGQFRAEVDMLLAVEYNKDINYFSNILESAARDIHCFAIQANSSHFGDSRIIAPSSTDEMNFVRIRGGINPLLIKSRLNISELRDFQSKIFDKTDCRFKPTSAGFDHKKARNRN